LDKTVVFEFVLNGLPYELNDMGIPPAFAQGGFDIDLLIGKKTTPQVAVCGESQAVAPITEMVTQCPDQTQFSSCPFQDIPFCRSVQMV
jgi:hypothetical protein